MIKKQLYPKTKRVGLKNEVVITEKLDGSNIGFYKLNYCPMCGKKLGE